MFSDPNSNRNVDVGERIVATSEGFDRLEKIGIDYAQGYWIEKPRPIADVFQNPQDTERRALRLVGSE